MRSHFIAGWGSWKSRRIPRFLSKARSGWSYCCRLAPAVLTAAGLSAAAGDGGAAFFGGGGGRGWGRGGRRGGGPGRGDGSLRRGLAEDKDIDAAVHAAAF